jgi:hypothetical protein
VEHKKDSKGDAGEASNVVPFERFAQERDGENREDGKGDHFLNGFQLRGGEFIRADSIVGELKAGI